MLHRDYCINYNLPVDDHKQFEMIFPNLLFFLYLVEFNDFGYFDTDMNYFILQLVKSF